MGLDGGGAGGGGILGVGDSFTGAAEALEIIGNHCYAYSGAFAVSDTDEHKLLSFTTGNFYSLVDFTFWRRSWEDDDISYYVEMNGTQVVAWIGRSSEPNGSNMPIPLVIPAYTLLEAYIDKQQQANDSIVGINITGRIYRA